MDFKIIDRLDFIKTVSSSIYVSVNKHNSNVNYSSTVLLTLAWLNSKHKYHNLLYTTHCECVNYYDISTLPCYTPCSHFICVSLTPSCYILLQQVTQWPFAHFSPLLYFCLSLCFPILFPLYLIFFLQPSQNPSSPTPPPTALHLHGNPDIIKPIATRCTPPQSLMSH